MAEVPTPPKKRAAIFDFDGTLADSMEHVIEVYNQSAQRLGVPTMTAEDIAYLRTLKPLEALKHIQVPMWKVPRIVHAVRSGMQDRMHLLQPFPGIDRALDGLRELGVRCYILSTNSSVNIEAFLKRHHLDHFHVAAGGSSAFGKASHIRKLIKREGLTGADVFYVGDEVRDVNAAADAGVRSVAVSWGYSDRNALAAEKPDHLIDHPSELPERMAK